MSLLIHWLLFPQSEMKTKGGLNKYMNNSVQLHLLMNNWNGGGQCVCVCCILMGSKLVHLILNIQEANILPTSLQTHAI